MHTAESSHGKRWFNERRYRVLLLLSVAPTPGCNGDAGLQLVAADLSIASMDQSASMPDAPVEIVDAGPSATVGTGGPCAQDSDCLGTMAGCLMEPGGSCTSHCEVHKNDPLSGQNPDCSGGGCETFGGDDGLCVLLCTARDGGAPCARPGYSCAGSNALLGECTALPSYFDCDPDAPGSCPIPDGGALDDGGAPYQRACLRAGPDNIGNCRVACDPFAPHCPNFPVAPPNFPAGCYPSYDTGQGLCFPLTSAGADTAGDGAPCPTPTWCARGLACTRLASVELGFPPDGVCRPYCGGPAKVACRNGKACVPLSPKVPVSVLGLCAG